MFTLDDVKGMVDLQSNCLGYGEWVTKTPLKLPIKIAAMAIGMVTVLQAANTITSEVAEQFKAQITDIEKNIVPKMPQLSAKVFVVNKNIFSQILNFIVRIFAAIFGTSKNYIIFYNPMNPEQVLRMNKYDWINDLFKVFRVVMTRPQLVDDVISKHLTNPIVTALIPDQEGLLKKFEGEKDTPETKALTPETKALHVAAATGVLTFVEQLKSSQTVEQRALSVDLFIKAVKPAVMNDVSTEDLPGFAQIMGKGPRPAPRNRYRPAAVAEGIPRTN